MDDADAPKTHGTLPPETALSLLADEVRATIVWTLSEARGGEGPPPVVPFAELRDRSGVDVDSGHFNYHLQQLVGTYVERVGRDGTGEAESGDAPGRPVPEMAARPGESGAEGYRLTPEGTTLVRLVRAWSADDAAFGPVDVGQGCYYCDTPLEARYANAVFAIQCPGCGYLYDYNLTPPGILGEDDAAVLRRVAAYNRHVRDAFARGVCPYCANDVDAAFQDPAETGYPRGDRREVLVRRGCDHCGNKDNLTVGEVLLGDARLVSFCLDHGLDVTDTPIWELEFAATDRHTTVRSTDPWTVAVGVERGDDRLELVVDESLTVVDASRTDG